MTDTLVRDNAYLNALAAPIRERRATPVRATVVALALSLVAACGGGRHGDTYAKATSAEQGCCEHLTGPGHDECLQKIVRVDDPEVAKTSTNQSTYACIQEHFSCDAQTGHATAASAQAQMDCIQDLP